MNGLRDFMEGIMHIKNKRGQSTVEYILLVTAVVAVIIVFATNKNGVFQTTLNNALSTTASDMNVSVDALSKSHAPSTTAGVSLPPPYTVDAAP